MMSAVKGYFEEQDSSYYKKGIELIEHLWEKCIDLKGDYVKNIYFLQKCSFLFWVGYFRDHPHIIKCFLGFHKLLSYFTVTYEIEQNLYSSYRIYAQVIWLDELCQISHCLLLESKLI